MQYSILADTYDKLEKTSGKLEKTRIIAELLKETSAEDLERVVLLLNGSVFPAWSAQEIGVASQLMIRAIAKACGISEDAVLKKFKHTGDLGLAVEASCGDKKQKTFASKSLTIEKVFTNIQKLAAVSGKGSQEQKISLIAELLVSAKPSEAKYIVRTTLGQLRIGVAEGLIRDAIAQAFSAGAETVESAWFLRPDYGEIASIAKKEGETGLKKVKIRLGEPMMVQLAEKSPSLKEALESFENPSLEYKYDGMRTIIQKKDGKVWVFTRNLEDVTRQFPDIAELCKKGILARECVIEGETIGMDRGKPLPFQHLSQRIHRKYDIEEMVKKIPVQINLFDATYLDGEMLLGKPLKERRKILEKIIKQIPGKFQLSERLVTRDLKEADKFYKKALAEGNEGVIVKNLDALYHAGRRVAGGWLKVKPTMENLDLVIIGADYGTGKRAGWFGSFVLGCRDPENGKFLECGMLGTGVKEKKTEYTDVTLKEFTKMLKPLIEKEEGNRVWFKPKIVIEVAYEEIQKSPSYSSGYALRFPRFVRLRIGDKSAEQADTKERIARLYGTQKGGR
jgi:DNA ligase 1